jgi:hypothetical protein
VKIKGEKMMKYFKHKWLQRMISAILVFSLVLVWSVPVLAENGQPDTDDISSEAEFTDIKGHTAEAEIIRAVDQGLMNGYEDGSFRPDHTISRAEFVTALHRMLYDQSAFLEENAFVSLTFMKDQRFHPARLPYKDVKQGDWMFDEVLDAQEAINALKGKGSFQRVFKENMFKPNQPITVLESALLLDAFFFFSMDQASMDEQYRLAGSLTNNERQSLFRLMYLDIIGKEEAEALADPITRAAAAVSLSRTYDILEDYTLIPSFANSLNAFEYDTEVDLSGDFLFASYSDNVLTEQDNAYLNIVAQIESDEIDNSTLEQLRQLKNSGYRNQSGVLFYLAYLDDTLGAEERNEMLGQVIIQLSKSSSGSLVEWLTVLDAMQNNATYADLYGKRLDIRSSVQQSLGYLSQSSNDIRRLVLAYLAYEDRKMGNDSTALTKYQQIVELKMNRWSLNLLAEVYASIKQWNQGAIKFTSYLGQLKDTQSDLVPVIKVIIADLRSAADQKAAISILDKAYTNISNQDGLKSFHFSTEDQWFGTFEQTSNFKNGVTYLSGKYYTENSLTPKKYEEYRKQENNNQNTVYYFTSDIKEWRFTVDSGPDTLANEVGRLSFEERLDKWNTRYILKETDAHFIIFEYFSGDRLTKQFGGQTFSNGTLSTVNQFIHRYEIDKNTMLLDRDSWNYVVQYDSSYFPNTQFGSTYYLGFGANQQSIPASVLKQAKKDD